MTKIVRYTAYMICSIGIIATTSCGIFNPNFLVGIWIGSGPDGDNRITFTKEAEFTAKFYTEDGSPETISGSYTAGPAVIQLAFNGEKRSASYTLYSNAIDFVWEGKIIRLFRYK